MARLGVANKPLLNQAKAPLDAIVSRTCKEIVRRLAATGLSVETASGGRTTWKCIRIGVPKTYARNAAAVGVVDASHGWTVLVLAITVIGRGSCHRTKPTAHNLPCGYLMRQKTVYGFQTGDMVRATVPSDKKAGIHVGRVAVQAFGSFRFPQLDKEARLLPAV